MVKAYAAMEASGTLKEFEYELGELNPHDVEIEIKSCGICHSDVSMWKNHWNITQYPFVGGHEIAGVVKQVGSLVQSVKVGDNVGVGWHKGYCNTCNQCLGGDHNLCPGQVGTIVANHGGFADVIRAQDTSVIKIPEGVSFKDAGPLLCGGITVFNPLVQFGMTPTSHVAVLGIGGLGHLALQFANAWGCEVTAFTSEGKMEEAKKMGAHNCINSRAPDKFADYAGSFDLIISTVNVNMDWSTIISTLKPKGRMHFVGVVPEPIGVAAFQLIGGQVQVSGTPVGAPATLNTMMEFAARHKINPITEHFKFNQINEALAHLESGKARYRIVLEH